MFLNSTKSFSLFSFQRVENLTQLIFEAVLDVFEEIFHEEFVMFQHDAKLFGSASSLLVLVHQELRQIGENALSSARIRIGTDDLLNAGMFAD